MAKLKNIFWLLIVICGLLIPRSVQAVRPVPATPPSVQIADYTAFPPFLPRVVSPNILFLLDYSQNMVRPAYGECNDQISNCRTSFINPKDDYDPSFEYSGYFDPGPDGKYTCDSTGCAKDSSGEWKGNWLNWLAMTQFDVLKMVTVGGDAISAPEQGNPHHMGSRNLTSGRVFHKMMKVDTCKANAPDAQCATVAPLSIPYKWIDTPTSGVTPIFENVTQTGGVGTVASPFDFTLYGQTFAAGTDVSVNVNGWLTFTPSAVSVSANAALPTSTLYDYTIAPYWDNFELISSKGSAVKAFTVGSAPNRIFVVTFENMINEDLDTGKADPFTFQALLFEGSSQIVFQYKDVKPDKAFGGGFSATVGVQGDASALEALQSSYDTAGSVSNLSALVMTPDVTAFTVKTDNTAMSQTTFQPYGSSTAYPVWVAVNGVAKNSLGNCPAPGSFPNKYKDQCYDHRTEGLMQEFRDGEIAGLLGFRLGLMLLNEHDGGNITKHFNQKDDAGWASLITDTRASFPKADAPLAEGLYEALGYFKNDNAFDFGSDFDTLTKYDPYFFESANQKVPCAKSYVLLVSSGNYSHDNTTNIFGDAANTESWTPTWSNGWRSTDDAGSEGTKANGGWLDNVAYELHTASKIPSPDQYDLRPETDLPQAQVVTLYTIDTFGAESGDGTDVLKKAARYGGFSDLDKDGQYDAGDCSAAPQIPDEADKNCDGRPDTYFSASTGSLRSQISNAVADILRNSASGTSVSVLSTSAGGEGALYQAYFYPAKVDSDNREARWPGYLRSFFIDRYQNLRDDYSGGTPDQEMEFSQDRVVQMFLNGDNAVKVKLYSDSNGDGQLSDTEKVSNPPIVDMDEVPSLWEAGKRLAERDKSTRNIYLWADTGLDGFAKATDGDFASASVSGSETLRLATNDTDRDTQATLLKPFLRAGDILYNSATWVSAQDEAEGLIDYVLGEDVNRVTTDGGTQEYRGRCIDVDYDLNDGCPAGQNVWPLGDIIFSTPTLVAGPTERYDKIYGTNAPGYTEFYNEYKNRRKVVYVGANDGMLHAFNGGIYHEGDDDTTDSKAVTGYFTDGPTWFDGRDADIGDELWAFLPYDNLPHMPWLACNGTDKDPSVCGDSEYTHVYYTDMRAKVTDVQIFNHDSVTDQVAGQAGVLHPQGWGTILILGMRLGGGAMDLDLDGSTIDGDIPSEKFRSAYYALDITQPEQPPRLLWRFYDDALGFSTSYPGIARIKTAGGAVGWYMVVGSGPKNGVGSGNRDYDHDGTTTHGKIFVVDLITGTAVKTFDNGFANSIMGDPTTVDVDLDFSVDTIYIGSSFGPVDSGGGPGGRVYRINTKKVLPASFGTWELTTLFDPDPGDSSATTTIDPDPDAGKDMGPVLIGPSVAKDKSGNLWVYFGSGQLKKRGDLTNSDQQRFYGIKDKCWKDVTTAAGCDKVTATEHAYTIDDLLNTTDVKVYQLSSTKDADHQVAIESGGDQAPCKDGNGVLQSECSYATVLDNVKAKSGWRVDLIVPASGPSERVLSKSSVLGGLVLFTTYEPSGDLCSIFGDSWLYSLFYETGTAYSKPTLGTTDEGSEKIIIKREGIGEGMPTSVGVAVGESVSGFVQKSTGEIKQLETEPAFKLKSGPSSWREEPSGGGTVGLETIYKHIVK